MQTAAKRKKGRGCRIPGSRKNGSGITGNTQRASSRCAIKDDRLSGTEHVQCISPIPAPQGTCAFNTSGLNFNIKMGFEILKQYGVRIDFSQKEKVDAYMLHTCLCHIPGYNNLKFKDPNDAICHVYRSAAMLITGRFGFMFPNGDRDEDSSKIPGEYFLQIVYQDFDVTGGRWQSFCDLESKCNGDKELIRALYMCIRTILFDFHFHLFDEDGGTGVMDMEDWYRDQYEQASEELDHIYKQFEEANTRPFDPRIDIDGDDVDHIHECIHKVATLEDEMIEYNKKAKPMIKRIHRAKYKRDFLVKQIKRFESTPENDVSDWIRLVIHLHDIDFCIDNFIADSYRNSDDTIDEESMGPTSVYGYIFDGDSTYADCINDYYNEYAGNVSIVPFAINEVICPKKGQIYKTPDIPFGEWVSKLFRFDFSTLKYEINR